MRIGRSVLALSAASLILVPSTIGAAELNITHELHVTDLVYVKTETECACKVFEAIGGREPKEDFEPFTTTPREWPVDLYVDRAVSWRLVVGKTGDFDWSVIREALRLFYGVDIGKYMTCHIQAVVKPALCYDVTAHIYAPYCQDFYKITQAGKVALVSVLTPLDGAAIHYNVRNDPLCAGPTLEFLSNEGVCAAIVQPAVGCDGDDKRRFKDDLMPMDRPFESSTWGKIKALYE
jgi:hypothetical protein